MEDATEVVEVEEVFGIGGSRLGLDEFEAARVWVRVTSDVGEGRKNWSWN